MAKEDDLSKKERKEVEFKLVADPDIEEGIHKIQMMAAYSDKLGNNYSQTSIISLIVGDEPELAVGVENSEIKEKGASGEVTIKFVNKGVSDIKFLYVKIEESDDYELLSSDDSYIGNIDSDDFETADFRLFVESTDKKQVLLPIILEYKDTNNNDYKDSIELALNLYTAAEAKKLGLKNENGFVGILIVIIIVAIGLWYYRKQRKNKKKA